MRSFSLWISASLAFMPSQSLTARQSGHSPQIVGKYLRGCERAKLLLAHGTPATEIAILIDLQSNVVTAFVNMLQNIAQELSRPKRRRYNY
ncbi:MAG: hypothetical protein ACOY0R_06455 [Chloroflexota bacterium]